jgi:hypothetical protein
VAQTLSAPWKPHLKGDDDVTWFSHVDEDELDMLREWDFVEPEKDWSGF